MIRTVVNIIKCMKIEYRVVLSCGHTYTRRLSDRDRVKRKYFCHSCNNQQEVLIRGGKPNLKLRLNK